MDQGYYGPTMLPVFFDSVLDLIVKTSTELPPDVRAAMRISLAVEPEGTRSSQALTIIAQNIDLAVDNEGAICQDTGMPTFEVKAPVGANQIWMRQQMREAVAEATRRGKLRPNSVDSITGKNSGDNLGPGTPIIHFDQWESDDIEIKLILKGGGCENTNTAAGPTTSIREEPYQGEIIMRYGIRAVIGKGGMGSATLAPLKEHGAVY